MRDRHCMLWVETVHSCCVSQELIFDIRITGILSWAHSDPRGGTDIHTQHLLSSRRSFALGSSSRSAHLLHTSGNLACSPHSPTCPRAPAHEIQIQRHFSSLDNVPCNTSCLHPVCHISSCFLVPFYRRDCRFHLGSDHRPLIS